MQKVKLFKSIESELVALESEINAWIESSGAKIVSLTGNIAPQTSGSHGGTAIGSFSSSDVLIVVVYEAGN
ncbi:MAG: hypothetical protein CL681_14210 [Blastopirellula sp.]|nr:hypothetical protein [Blastopirellula sp.]